MLALFASPAEAAFSMSSPAAPSAGDNAFRTLYLYSATASTELVTYGDDTSGQFFTNLTGTDSPRIFMGGNGGPWYSMHVDSGNLEFNIYPLTASEEVILTVGTSGFDLDPLTLDSSNNRVGINQPIPQQALDVSGNGIVTGTMYLGGAVTANSTLAVNGNTTLGTSSAEDTLSITAEAQVTGALQMDASGGPTPWGASPLVFGGTLGSDFGNGAPIFINADSYAPGGNARTFIENVYSASDDTYRLWENTGTGGVSLLIEDRVRINGINGNYGISITASQQLPGATSLNGHDIYIDSSNGILNIGGDVGFALGAGSTTPSFGFVDNGSGYEFGQIGTRWTTDYLYPKVSQPTRFYIGGGYGTANPIPPPDEFTGNDNGGELFLGGGVPAGTAHTGLVPVNHWSDHRIQVFQDQLRFFADSHGFDYEDPYMVADHSSLEVAVDPANASAEWDFSVDEDTLYVDSSLERVGINDDTPDAALDITPASGNASVIVNSPAGTTPAFEITGTLGSDWRMRAGDYSLGVGNIALLDLNTNGGSSLDAGTAVLTLGGSEVTTPDNFSVDGNSTLGDSGDTTTVNGDLVVVSTDWHLMPAVGPDCSVDFDDIASWDWMDTYLEDTNSGTPCYYRVSLLPGSTITQLRFKASSDDPAEEAALTYTLQRRDDSGTTATWTTVATGTLSNFGADNVEVQTANITDHTILASNVYRLKVSGDHGVAGSNFRHFSAALESGQRYN